MIEVDEVRQAVAAVRTELARLDARLGEVDGVEQLPAAQALVKLDKVCADLVKLAVAVTGKPPANGDGGPKLPGFDPDQGDDQGGADRGRGGRKKR